MKQFKKTNKLRVSTWLLLLISLLIKPILSQTKSHEQEIKLAYDNWVTATNDKDIEEWGSFLAPDAIFHPPNNPALNGNKEITDFYSELFTDKLFALKCKQDTVIISESMDIAWSVGRCEATFTGPDGNEAKDKSKWVKIWVRLVDGDWKCKINSWSSSLKN